MTLITREQYMANSSELHQAFYLQFATNATEAFIRNRIGLEFLSKSNDKYFNDLGIKHSHGGAGSWIWDAAPVNVALMREAGAIGQRRLPSPSDHTCVAKACARHLLGR